VDKKKRNKLRNLRDRVAKQELEPPRATCRKKKPRKKSRRRVEERNELVRHYQAKATKEKV